MHILVAVGPSSLEEQGSDMVSGPTDAAVLSTLRLALTAGSFANIEAVGACSSRETRQDGRAGGPRNRMSSSNAKSCLVLSFEERSRGVAGDDG